MTDRQRILLSIVGVLAAVVITSCARQQGSTGFDDAEWTWYESGMELYSPQFSPDGARIALVRKRHTYDGHEAELVADDQIQTQRARIEKDERYADPQVIIVTSDQQIETVDWGWAPAFSPDGAKIVYAAQVSPISRYRVLASTLDGNGIRIYDRAARSQTTLAEPDVGYLTDPIFSPDGQQVVYSIGGAVNGAYGGNVGLGRVSIDSGLNETLLPPTKAFDLYYLVNSKGFDSDRLLAIRCIPAKEGTFLADEYLCDLLDADDLDNSVYSWGTRPFQDIYTFGFVSMATNGLLVFDRTWQPAEQASSSRSLPNSEATPDPGTASPNGLYGAHVSESMICIRELATGRLREQWEIDGQIQAIAWSPASDRVAVIATKYRDKYQDLFSHDALLVFSLDDSVTDR